MARAFRPRVCKPGMKGAVPLLLGTFIVGPGIAGASRAYEIIFVVVAFSVVVQGGFVPALAHRLNVPLRTIDPEACGPDG